MWIQELAQGYWRSLVKENTHSGNLGKSQTFRRMIKHRTHLLKGDAWEPLDKLSDLRPLFKVLKKCCDRDTRAAKHPRATHALGITLDR
jgi:hypothetical protein